MFVLKQEHEYDWPVKVKVPKDGGTFAEHEFTARFLVMPSDKAGEMLPGSVFAPPEADRVEEFLKAVLVGWKGVEDERGETIDFGTESRDALIRLPYVRNALFEAYGESVSGRTEKN